MDTSRSSVAEKDLFDGDGRLIPSPTSVVYSQVSRKYFRLIQPELKWKQIYHQISQGISKGFSQEIISLDAFETQAKEKLKTLKQDPQYQSLLNGVHLPFLCPKLPPSFDLGGLLDEKLLPEVGNSFKARFPDYEFKNHCTGQLKGNLQPTPGGKYSTLLAKLSQSSQVGWYFPNCLSEYSISSQRALDASLPSHLYLSGPIEAAMAMMGFPELLVKKDNHYPHLLCLASVSPKDQDQFFYHFEAYGWNLTFNRRSKIGAVSEYWAGGLTLI